MNARFAVALLTAALLLSMGSAYAAAGTTTGLVDIDIKNVPVRQAIDMIFDGRGARYIIEPGVAGKVVELKMKGITVAEALKSLGDAAGFTYTYEDGIYTISPKAPTTTAKADPPGDPPAGGATLLSSTSAPRGVIQRGSVEQPVRETISPSPSYRYQQLPAGGYGNNTYAYGGNGGYGNGYGNYGGGYGGYDPYGYYYNIQPPPWIMGQWANPPPPPGLFSPDVNRFLAFEHYVPKRPSFIMPPYWY